MFTGTKLLVLFWRAGWMEGKKVTIFFNDTPNTVSKREGTVLSQDELFVRLQTISGVISIPITKIVRIEEQKNGGN
jgi:hypothetical protein